MDWRTNHLRFRQVYVNGYRYLDKCGEFMVTGAEEFQLLPGEAKPTGVQMTLPEKGIRVAWDTNALEIYQEEPTDEKTFLFIVSGLTNLVQKLIGPLQVEESMFETRFYKSMDTVDEAESATLKVRGDDQKAIAREFEMASKHRRVDMEFSSGSTRLRVTLAPAAFETVRIDRHNPLINSTRMQATRANRLTTMAARSPKYASYAVIMDVTCTESEPPLWSEANLYKVARAKAETAKRLFETK